MILISAGANLATPYATPEQTIARLPALLARVKLLTISASSLYRTAALGMPSQTPDFINSVLLIKTDLAPLALLTRLQELEADYGRKRLQGQLLPVSRCLDLDLIAYHQLVLDSEQLTLPHPRLHQRLFVLEPLAQVAPAWYHPLLRKTASEMAALCSDQLVTKLLVKEEVND